MLVVFRVDASPRVGSGHLARCLTLARVLRQQGHQIVFVIRDGPGSGGAQLKISGYDVRELAVTHGDTVSQFEDAEQTIFALGNRQADWLVVDHYGLSAEWENLLRPQVSRLMVIDDLADRSHACDLLLDPGLHEENAATRYAGKIPTACETLSGPRYALLDPIYAQLRACMPARNGRISRLLVFFGGADRAGQTLVVLEALKDASFDHLEVDVVVGAQNLQSEAVFRLAEKRPGTTVCSALSSLAALMVRADLLIGAGGGTTWERCCLGLPALVTWAAENQRDSTEGLARIGAHFSLGGSEQTSADWAVALKDILSRPLDLASSAKAGMSLSQGLGVALVAATMTGTAPDFFLRPAVLSDENVLLEWANDPVVRKNAFTPEPISPESHHAWFCRRLDDPDCLIWVGESLDGCPVGQVRFDCHEGNAHVDISVDRHFRGKHLGQDLLRKALQSMRASGRTENVVAEVLVKNLPSQRLFSAVGFLRDNPGQGRSGSYRYTFALEMP